MVIREVKEGSFVTVTLDKDEVMELESIVADFDNEQVVTHYDFLTKLLVLNNLVTQGWYDFGELEYYQNIYNRFKKEGEE